MLGGGAIGLELAQVFHRFGADVTVVESAARVLALEEPENGEALGRVLSDEGITLRLNVRAERVFVGGRRRARGAVRRLPGSKATGSSSPQGRRSDLEAVGVAAAGLDPSARSIEVDDRMRVADGLGPWATSPARWIYPHRHLSGPDRGRRHPRPTARARRLLAVPRVTFTDPEVASVGLTQQQAEDAGIQVRVGVSDTSYSTRGSIHGTNAEHGVIKLIADADRGVLVGGSIMSPAAGEMLGIVMLAVRAQVPIQTLKDLIYPYPTFIRGLESSLAEL